MELAPSTKRFLGRMAAIVGISSVLLTASFVGVFAFLSGQVVGVGGRVPFYLIATAVVFVGTIVFLEEYRADGRLILKTTVIISTMTFLFAVLGAEGLLFAIREPEAVLTSQLLFYLLAAGLVATGLGYWSVKHWREFAGERDLGDR